MRPAGYEHDVFCPSERWIDYVRGAAARMAGDDRCPVRIHRHAFAADCAGETHELVDVDGPLRLELAAPELEVGRG